MKLAAEMARQHEIQQKQTQIIRNQEVAVNSIRAKERVLPIPTLKRKYAIFATGVIIREICVLQETLCVMDVVKMAILKSHVSQNKIQINQKVPISVK